MDHLQVLQPCGPRLRLRRRFQGPRRRTRLARAFPPSLPHPPGLPEFHHQTSASGPSSRGAKRFPSAIQCTSAPTRRPQPKQHGCGGHALADDDAASPAMHDLQSLPWPGPQPPGPFCACACAGAGARRGSGSVLVPRGFMLIMDPESCRPEPNAVLSSYAPPRLDGVLPAFGI